MTELMAEQPRQLLLVEQSERAAVQHDERLFHAVRTRIDERRLRHEELEAWGIERLADLDVALPDPWELRFAGAHRVRLERQADWLLAEEAEDLLQHGVECRHAPERHQRRAVGGMLPRRGVDAGQDTPRARQPGFRHDSAPEDRMVYACRTSRLLPGFPVARSGAQCLVEILHQVIDVLDPDRQADQAFRDAHAVAHLLRYGGVRHDGRVADERLDAAERFREREEAGALDNLLCALERAELQADHAGKAAHLTLRQLVLGMRRQARVVNRLDAVVASQELR